MTERRAEESCPPLSPQAIRSLVLGIIFGSAFFQRQLTVSGSEQLVSALYFSSVLANLNAFSFLPATTGLQAIYRRERAESMYSAWAYGAHHQAGEREREREERESERR